MTITYADGAVVEALVVSIKGSKLRLAVAGYDDDVRVFTRTGGIWRAKCGKEVHLRYSGQTSRPALSPGESHFICSGPVARQLIGNLVNGSEMQDGGSDPFYVFSAENRRVRVTVFRRTGRMANEQSAEG
jgi:hypothetical protein